MGPHKVDTPPLVKYSVECLGKAFVRSGPKVFKDKSCRYQSLTTTTKNLDSQLKAGVLNKL